jgi:predicted nucleic acid-binding protein
MRVFVDANILIAVLNKEYPLFTYAARVLSLSNRPGFHLYTSPLCLAIGFYFATKKTGEKAAKRKIEILLNNISITEINESVTKNALQNPKVHDFEDGMEYYSAINSDCQVIVTTDTEDFYFSEIQVLDSEAFLKVFY